MENHSQIGRASRFLIGIFLFSPILLTLLKLDQWRLPEVEEIWKAASQSLLQSILSALLSLFLGTFGAIGILAVRRGRAWVEFFAIAPSLFPSLIVIVSCLEFFRPFPFGLWGIVLVHAVIYSGLCARMISSWCQTKLGGVSELSAVEGATRFQFYLRGALPMLKRDLIGLWLFVFVCCLTSFAVPLIVGGPSVSTFEVLIYEKALVEGDLSQAAILGLMQSGFVLVLLLQIRSMEVPESARSYWHKAFGLSWGLIVPIGAFLVILGGLLESSWLGLSQLAGLNLKVLDLLGGIFGTLVVGFLVGGLNLAFLMMLACAFPFRRFESLVRGFVAPSTALAGVMLVFLGGGSLGESSGPSIFLKITFALSFLTLTSLVRLGFASTLESLRGQWQQAHILGARPWDIFRRVVLPQALPAGLSLAGLSAFWSCGDFAISGFIAGEDVTLGLIADSLLGSYRIEAAGIISILLLLLGGLCFLVFEGLSRVSRKTLIS